MEHIWTIWDLFMNHIWSNWIIFEKHSTGHIWTIWDLSMNQTILLLPGGDSTRLVSTKFSFSVFHIFAVFYIFSVFYICAKLVLQYFIAIIQQHLYPKYFDFPNHSEVNITSRETIGRCCQVAPVHLPAGLSSYVDLLHLPVCHCLEWINTIFDIDSQPKWGDVASEKDGWGPGGDGRLLYRGGGRGDYTMYNIHPSLREAIRFQ